MAASASTTTLSWLLAASSTAATTVHVDSAGGQKEEPSRNVTFVNMMSDGDCSLYWVGVPGSGPRIFYGPVVARGGKRTIEGFPGQTFSLTRVGTFELLAEYTIQEDSERFVLTDEGKEAAAMPRESTASELREAKAMSCRVASSCASCAGLTGCGWSLIRRRCFRARA